MTTLASFKGANYITHGTNPTEQEIFDRGIFEGALRYSHEITCLHQALAASQGRVRALETALRPFVGQSLTTLGNHPVKAVGVAVTEKELRRASKLLEKS